MLKSISVKQDTIYVEPVKVFNRVKYMILFYLCDMALVTFSFLFFIWLKPLPFRIYYQEYFDPFLIFLGIWIGASISSRKYTYNSKHCLNDFLIPVLISDFVALSVVTFAIAASHHFAYSRTIVFGTIFLSITLEVILLSLFYYYWKLNRLSDNTEAILTYLSHKENLTEKEILPQKISNPQYDSFTLSKFKNQIIEEIGENAFYFMCRHIDSTDNHTLVLSTTTRFNVKVVPSGVFENIINLKPINDIKRLNKFFEVVNSKLPKGGIYIDCVITNEIKKQHILENNPPVFNYIFYFFYYIFRRVFPKMPLMKKLYFFLTNGYDRAISKAEALGRLYSCGFEVITETEENGMLFFVARKVNKPLFDMHPTYGTLISLKRIGKSGKPIHVFKLRTMHPYSEYLQDYIYKQNNLQEGGKFRNDYRISTVGRIARKVWLDELPMFINLFKGDLKFVGVRPLSNHYLSLYTEELKNKRLRHKPGLFPPFYADMPKTLEEIMESESRYLDEYEKSPFLTDFRYFRKAFYNIVFRKARSN